MFTKPCQDAGESQVETLRPGACRRSSSCTGEIWDFGNIPVANRFTETTVDHVDRHQFRLAFNQFQGILSQPQPMPPRLLRRKDDWIQYNEPEAHLDSVVSDVISCFDTRLIFGLGPTDKTTLDRFRTYGSDCRQLWPLALSPAAQPHDTDAMQRNISSPIFRSNLTGRGKLTFWWQDMLSSMLMICQACSEHFAMH